MSTAGKQVTVMTQALEILRAHDRTRLSAEELVAETGDPVASLFRRGYFPLPIAPYNSQDSLHK